MTKQQFINNDFISKIVSLIIVLLLWWMTHSIVGVWSGLAGAFIAQHQSVRKYIKGLRS